MIVVIVCERLQMPFFPHVLAELLNETPKRLMEGVQISSITLPTRHAQKNNHKIPPSHPLKTNNHRQAD